MGTLMQLLLEALRANVGERNNEIGALEDQESEEMSGFILENVQVATMPYIESDEEEEEPNPLLQLVHNQERPRRGRNPQKINKILDHLVKLERKVNVLERCIPPNTFQQRLWLAPTKVSEDETGYDDYVGSAEDEDTREHSPGEKKHSTGSKRGSPSKSKSPHGSASKNGKKLSRVETRPIRLEKEERSCFARLLFSRCWTGKDHTAGWKIKRRCPTGHKASLSCPCGQIGPCRKVKGNAPPIDQMNSTSPGKKKTKGMACSTGSSFSRKSAGTKNQKTNTAKTSVTKPNGKPLYEKLFPCCFKEHVHNECCCRCADSPKLSGSKKSKEDVRKRSGSKHPTPKSSASASRKVTNSEGDSADPSEVSGDEEGSDYYDDQSEFQTYNIRSASDALQKNGDMLNHLSRKEAMDDKRKTSNHKNQKTKKTHRPKKDPESNTRWPKDNNFIPDKSAKSTTSFQIMLHPVLSDDKIPEPEVVSHQILKTLSTIHGPVKVEQKIVVQGSKNSVVIVTHGEACQCNLCGMLKGKMHPRELVEGLSPQIVKISTGNGCNTLINHSDGCKCELCGVLERAMTKNTENRTSQLENENLVMAACSTSNENGSGEKSTPEAALQTLHSNNKQVSETVPGTEVDNQEKDRNVASNNSYSIFKKSKCKTKNGKKKVKKCRCTKCRQRRRIERLKLRLKKEMGTKEYDRILNELSRHSNDDDRATFKNRKTSVQSDSDDNGYERRRRSKMVSFSDEPTPKHQAQSEGPAAYDGLNEKKRKCKLCDVMNMNIEEANESFKGKKDEGWPGQNNHSTVYSMNAGSHETPCDCQVYGSRISKENSDDQQLRSKSNGSEKGVYRFISQEQKCFPPSRIPKTSREKPVSIEKTLKNKRRDDFEFIDQDASRNPIKRGSSCSGRCRQDVPGEEANHRGMEPAILLQDGAFPQKFVYWSPRSRSNMATAYSSESYYVPDQDEFPIVNMECDESTLSSGRNTSSGAAPVHRVQIPVWFRMMPDRNTR